MATSAQIAERRINMLEDIVLILRRNGYQMLATSVEEYVRDLRSEQDAS